MRTSTNILKSLNSSSRSGAGQVVAYNSKLSLANQNIIN